MIVSHDLLAAVTHKRRIFQEWGIDFDFELSGHFPVVPHRSYGVGICQCGLQGRADRSTGRVGEATTRQHTRASEHPHQVSGFGVIGFAILFHLA